MESHINILLYYLNRYKILYNKIYIDTFDIDIVTLFFYKKYMIIKKF